MTSIKKNMNNDLKVSKTSEDEVPLTKNKSTDKEHRGKFFEGSDTEDEESESESESNSEDEESNKEVDETVLEKKIHLFGQKNGRRTNTFIAGWEISSEAMKGHLRTLKSRLACNGSIKKITYNGLEQTALHLQGNKITDCASFLMNEMGLTNLYIKKL